ncbi:N-acetyltransferase [Siccibacter colletis]|uniref:N-acetyltransferase n=1 Tax=Siccibacter colletis TaxID=1505757 RepID=UPI0028BDAB13|nr:N-acetyltransferase [Siccibacter colletis]WNN48677.1 N-acetyltransferase [Siccibacter colletis]
MIRAARSDDLPALLELWLVSTTQAHPFIDESYWLESLGLVREVYLPGAQTWVWEENGLKGFISVMDARFIGALFVAPDALSQGIGKALIRHAMARFPDLSLEVYQKNTRAVHFYHRQGFRIEESAWQEETHHPTWIMRWQADQTL